MSGAASVRGAVLAVLIAIPAAATARGGVGLSVECTVPGASLADVREPFDLAMERGGEAVLVRFDSSGAGHSFQLLRMPGCQVLSMPYGPLPKGVHPMAVRPGGARLVAALRFPDGRSEWWYSSAPGLEPVQVPPATDGRVAGQPILSDDGAWAVWVQQTPGTGRQVWQARELSGPGTRSGETSSLGAGSYEALGFDQKNGILTLVRNGTELVDVDAASGRLLRNHGRLGNVSSQPHTLRRLASGWFAWDAYRDDTPWRAVWSVGGRAGRYDVDWSKMIAGAAVNPSGTWAALSLDTRFGRIPLGSEAFVLVRLADGKEVFRKKLPRFTRTRVAFLGDRHLAWMEGGAVVVGRISDQPPG